MPSGPQIVYRFGVFEADVRAGELRKAGRRVRLQEQPLQVLLALLERAGEVVTREELRQRLWPADTFVDFDHGLNTAINKVRDALGDGAASPLFLETVPKRGYRFIAPVQKLDPPAAVSRTTPSPSVAPGRESAPDSQRVSEGEGSESVEIEGGVGELPVVHPRIGRVLLALMQFMYLCFYVVALARLPDVGTLVESVAPQVDWPVMIAVLVTAALGIPVRLYLFSAVAFDYRLTGEKFRRLFPLVLLLDELWALAPFLLAPQIGIGLAFAACAALLYSPFSQRTLMRMTYPVISRPAALAVRLRFRPKA